MGSRGRRDAEFQGDKPPNLHFNELVSGVRIGRGVHQFYTSGGKIFSKKKKLRSDPHGRHPHQLQQSPCTGR